MTYGIVAADKITTSDGVSSAGLYGFKNRLINGSMDISQRGTSSVTQTTTDTYTLDRWMCGGAVTSKFTVQQNAGSVTPPSGYSKYLGVTSSSAYSVGASDFYYVMQGVEGLNLIDLAFGTASAATVTLSFWVRSSLTGSFGGALRNKISGADRSYPFTYTISAANTWEQKTITVAGDTSGTWAVTNACSLTVCFGLGAGSTFSGTSGAWATGNFIQPTGTTSVVGTSGATFYVTGVQLEKGSTATSFDYRPYGTELALCQRYYQKIDSLIVSGYQTTSNSIYAYYTLPVEMRASPTLAFTQGNASNAGNAASNATNTKMFGVLSAITTTGFGYRIFSVEMTGAEL